MIGMLKLLRRSCGCDLRNGVPAAASGERLAPAAQCVWFEAAEPPLIGVVP
jgi:hypothetical protein